MGLHAVEYGWWTGTHATPTVAFSLFSVCSFKITATSWSHRLHRSMKLRWASHRGTHTHAHTLAHITLQRLACMCVKWKYRCGFGPTGERNQLVVVSNWRFWSDKLDKLVGFIQIQWNKFLPSWDRRDQQLPIELCAFSSTKKSISLSPKDTHWTCWKQHNHWQLPKSVAFPSFITPTQHGSS